MSLTFPDCFSDLLCGEDAGILAADEPEYSSDLEFPADIEESIAGFLELEGVYSPGLDYPARFRSRSLDASARKEAVAWILKVHAFYRFQPLTAYLSVNYMDRFLSSHCLPQANGWPIQLLSVASLSLAAKMEETQVPSLLDLQVEGARFIFEPRTICRMEILILTTLNWRLRSITPFTFLEFFAYKVDSNGTFIKFLVSRATQIILAIIQEIDFLNYWPSSVAAAAILCAADAIPDISMANPRNSISWCIGMSKERIISCYQLMQDIVVDSGRRKRPKVLQQLRVTTPAGTGSGDLSSSSSSSPNKKRKLNNCLWVDEDKEGL
ncbi:CYCLIN D1;1 [Tasmannia lanceolata]|uniref:CYCLIN D1;1 n=1 Tax=Tasmannia lanceolata TaxID=3420 RepID=UPI0040649453